MMLALKNYQDGRAWCDTLFCNQQPKKKKSSKMTSNSKTDPVPFNLSASTAERSIPTAQMKLKRARLADDLNEKIALRPGPLELVEKNILPMDSSVKEAIKGSWGRGRHLCPILVNPRAATVLAIWESCLDESCCGLLSKHTLIPRGPLSSAFYVKQAEAGGRR